MFLMMFFHRWRSICLAFGVLLITHSLASCSESTQEFDERVLRQTFLVPENARLTSIVSEPKGWGPRENLRIHATFQFSDLDFDVYQAKQRDRWTALPMSTELLLKVTGDEQIAQAQTLVTPLSQDNPKLTDPQPRSQAKAIALKRWQDWLYLDVETGAYQCLTAGDNILAAPKRSCLSENGDLRDFMIAVLDDQDQTLNITVRTGY